MKRIAIFGDSILKGITIDKEKSKYVISKDVNWELIENTINVKIDNHSKMGSTVTKGYNDLVEYLDTNPKCDTILLEFGGNDCDHDWNYVSKNKSRNHAPKTNPSLFKNTLIKMIDLIKSKNIKPLLVSLPPIHSEKYFNWISKNPNDPENILYFLGYVDMISDYHNFYNMILNRVSKEKEIELLDLNSYLSNYTPCEITDIDGIHPNDLGRKKIIDFFTSYNY